MLVSNIEAVHGPFIMLICEGRIITTLLLIANELNKLNEKVYVANVDTV